MGDVATDRFGTLAHALENAARLGLHDPALAIEQLQEILKVHPGHAGTRAMLARVFRTVADQSTLAGDSERAAAAYAQSIRHSVHDPVLQQAATALCRNDLAVAERLLRERLKQAPTDVAAIRMLAEIGARLGRHRDAENLLLRAIELAPDFEAARHNLAIIQFRQQKLEEARSHIDWLLDRDPHNIQYRNLKAATLARLGEYADAIPLYRQLAREIPGDARIWLGLGHALRSAGQNDECVAAYRRCIEARPAFGEAWWSLANLKTFRFGKADIERMEELLATGQLTEDDRLHFHFSLGKAREDEAAYGAAFAHYEKGNAIRHLQTNYSADETSAHVARSKALFTPAFFAARKGQGCPDPAPIFIVGLPRAGSTLIEQILASHSLVEGTMELPDLTHLARRIADQKRKSDPSKYPDGLAALDAQALRALGEEYIARTRIHRKTGRPFFIDKMPNNFAHVGMIHLILPNARIIDARRHPLGACLSAFKQHFARGQTFSYSLTDLGRYYRDYVELMAHVDAVLPGRVHRVFYERLVTDFEPGVRQLLDYCGLAFEPECLSFHTNTRAVRTASSEQVRRPLYRDALDHWKHFDAWLQPLKDALGPALGEYPAAPVAA
ncbi:MAG: tetratricopeptide repeat-containing sulfotransferase family protein [Alphaproteobacteria bacterium]